MKKYTNMTYMTTVTSKVFCYKVIAQSNHTVLFFFVTAFHHQPLPRIMAHTAQHQTCRTDDCTLGRIQDYGWEEGAMGLARYPPPNLRTLLNVLQMGLFFYIG